MIHGSSVRAWQSGDTEKMKQLDGAKRTEKKNRQLEKTKLTFVCQTFRSMRNAHLRSKSKLFVCLPKRYATNVCKPNLITPFLFPETFRT